MNESRLSGLLGLAFRAGQLSPGADQALDKVRGAKAELVLLDLSSAPNTRKKLTDSCAHYGISLLEVPKGLLGQAIGKPDVKVAALLPGGLADQIRLMLTTGGETALADKNILEDTRLHD